MNTHDSTHQKAYEMTHIETSGSEMPVASASAAKSNSTPPTSSTQKPSPAAGAPTALTPVSQLLASREIQQSGVVWRLPADWLQGRTAFGGVIALMAAQSMRDVAGEGWAPEVSLLALQTTFIGPLPQGLVRVEVELLRQGKNVRQVMARVMACSDDIAATVVGVFGSRRDSAITPHAPTRSEPKAHPAAVPSVPFRPGFSPAFTRHFDIRWDDGPLPFSSTGGLATRVHLNLREDADVPTELMTILMADACPTPLLGHFAAPTAASSMTWALELQAIEISASHGRPRWWRADNEVLATQAGYANQVTRLWAPDGSLASLGYQVVAVFG